MSQIIAATKGYRYYFSRFFDRHLYPLECTFALSGRILNGVIFKLIYRNKTQTTVINIINLRIFIRI